MRAHAWEDLGLDTSYVGERRWRCRSCGAEEFSIDEPWAEDESDRVHITAIKCGGGRAATKILKDCDGEFVRRIMTS